MLLAVKSIIIAVPSAGSMSLQVMDSCTVFTSLIRYFIHLTYDNTALTLKCILYIRESKSVSLELLNATFSIWYQIDTVERTIHRYAVSVQNG